MKLNRAMNLGVVVVSDHEMYENAMNFLCEVRSNLDIVEKSSIDRIIHDMTDEDNESLVDVLQRYDDMFAPMYDKYLIKFNAQMVAVLEGNGEIVPLWKLDELAINQLNDIPEFKLHDVAINFNWKSREGDTLAQCITSNNKVRTIITLRNKIENCGLCESKTFVDDRWDALRSYVEQYCN